MSHPVTKPETIFFNIKRELKRRTTPVAHLSRIQLKKAAQQRYLQQVIFGTLSSKSKHRRMSNLISFHMRHFDELNC